MLHYPEETKSKIIKYLFCLMAISCSALYVIYTVILVPMYTYFSTDILFMGSLLPFFIRILLEIIDVAIFAVAYFSIIYAFFRERMSQKPFLFPIVYLALALARRAISLLVEFISSGYVGMEDLLSLGLYYLFDIIQLIVVMIIVIWERNKCICFITERKKLGIATSDLLPFNNVLDKNNPLQACSLKLAVLVAGIKIVTRIISDIYYGLPASISEVLVMAAYYLSDLLNGVVFYVLLWFLFNHINKKETALLNAKTVLEDSDI